MKWILTIIFSCVFAANSFGQASVCVRCLPRAPVDIFALRPQAIQPPMLIQAAPAQTTQAIRIIGSVTVPSIVQVQTAIPQTTLRWGFFRRRLIPRTRYIMGPTLQYTLSQPEGQNQPGQ